MSTTRPWAPQGVVDDLLNVHDDGEDERQVGKLTGPELSDEVRFDGRRDRDGAGRHGEVASSSRFVGRFDAIPTTRRTSPQRLRRVRGGLVPRSTWCLAPRSSASAIRSRNMTLCT